MLKRMETLKSINEQKKIDEGEETTSPSAREPDLARKGGRGRPAGDD